MNIPPFQLAVFDLDGTLIDTMSNVLRAYEYALAPYGPVPEREEIYKVLGGPGRRGLETLLPPGAPVEEAWRRLWDYASAHHRRSGPHGQQHRAAGQLEAGRQDGGPLDGPGSGKHDPDFAHYGLTPFFSDVVCGDDLPSHKPDPEGLFLLMDRLGRRPGRCGVYRRYLHDVRAGLRAGVFTVAVGPNAHQLEPRPHLVVRDLHEWQGRCCPFRTARAVVMGVTSPWLQGAGETSPPLLELTERG